MICDSNLTKPVFAKVLCLFVQNQMICSKSTCLKLHLHKTTDHALCTKTLLWLITKAKRKKRILMTSVHVVLKFPSLPCLQLSHQGRCIFRQNHCSFVTRGSDAILFSRSPKERVALPPFIWLSSSTYKSSAPQSLVYEEKHQICTNGEKENYITDNISALFMLWWEFLINNEQNSVSSTGEGVTYKKRLYFPYLVW